MQMIFITFMFTALMDRGSYSIETFRSSPKTTLPDDVTLRKFITDLLGNLLKWEWVVLVFMERDQDFSLQLVTSLFHQNMAITLIIPEPGDQTSSHLNNILNTVQVLLRINERVRVLLICKTEEGVNFAVQLSRFNQFFSARIEWVFFIPAMKHLTEFSKRSPIEENRVCFTFRDVSGEFVLRIPRDKDEPDSQPDQTGTKLINSWSPETGFATHSQLFGSKNKTAFSNLQGRKLKIALQRHFPFFLPPGYLQIPHVIGSDIFMLNNIAKYLNFTYEVVQPPDGQWGRLSGNHWSGLIGMVTRNEVDAALSGLSISYDRHKAVDFSVPYAFDRTTFVTKVPEKRPKTWVVFWPYTLQMWLAVMVSLVIISIILVFLQNASCDFYKKNDKVEKLSFYNSLTYVFQAIVGQGYYNAQERSCRILFSAWWLFVITVVTGYNGNLMSYMTNPGMREPIDTNQRLLKAIKKGIIMTGTIRDSADHAMFKESEEDFMQVILSTMDLDPNNLVKHDVDGLREVAKRSYAYIGGEMTVKADVWNPYLFLFAKESFVSYGYGIAFQKGFPYKDAFNKKIVQLRESGLIDKWILTMIQMNQTPVQLDVKSDHPLNIEDVQGAFLLLGIGFALSSIAFVLEISCSKCTGKVTPGSRSFKCKHH